MQSRSFKKILLPTLLTVTIATPLVTLANDTVNIAPAAKEQLQLVLYESHKQTGALGCLGDKLYTGTKNCCSFLKNQTYGRLHQNSLIKRSIDFTGEKAYCVAQYKKTIIACGLFFGLWTWVAKKQNSWNPQEWFKNWKEKFSTLINKAKTEVKAPTEQTKEEVIKKEEAKPSLQQVFKTKYEDAITAIKNDEAFTESSLLPIEDFMYNYYKEARKLANKESLTEKEANLLDDISTDIAMTQVDRLIAIYYEAVAKLEKEQAKKAADHELDAMFDVILDKIKKEKNIDITTKELDEFLKRIYPEEYAALENPSTTQEAFKLIAETFRNLRSNSKQIQDLADTYKKETNE